MASPTIESHVQHQDPSQPLPDLIPPVHRAPKPRVVPMGWARKKPPFGLTEMEIEYYHLARRLEETAYLPYGVQKVIRHPSLEADTIASLHIGKRTQPQGGLQPTSTPGSNMAEPSSTKKRAVGSKELWEEIKTVMTTLETVYHDYALAFIKGMPSDVLGIEASDMKDLAKPPSVEQCIQRLVTAFTEKAFQECIDDAFDALDYQIADKLSEASRALRARLYEADDTHNEHSPQNNAQKRASGKYLDDAKKFLSMWEMMSEDDMQKKVKAQLSDNPDTMQQQLIQLAFVDRNTLSVHMVERYILAAQVYRAGLMLKDFLAKVKPLTKALVSAFDDLKKLQK